MSCLVLFLKRNTSWCCLCQKGSREIDKSVGKFPGRRYITYSLVADSQLGVAVFWKKTKTKQELNKSISLDMFSPLMWHIKVLVPSRLNNVITKLVFLVFFLHSVCKNVVSSRLDPLSQRLDSHKMIQVTQFRFFPPLWSVTDLICDMNA